MPVDKIPARLSGMRTFLLTSLLLRSPWQQLGMKCKFRKCRLRKPPQGRMEEQRCSLLVVDYSSQHQAETPSSLLMMVKAIAQRSKQ
jgi:hypothetical protein